MVYSQLFVTDEEQQNALRRAQQDQALGRNFQQRGSLTGNNSNANIMQQLQQAQANLNQQLRDAGSGGQGGNNSNANAALLQAQLSQQLGSNFPGGLGAGGLGGNLGGNSLMGGNLGAQFGASEYLGQLNQFGGANLGGNLGGGPSLLEMQRAENLLAAMASNNGMQNIGGMGQLSSMMNANSQAALLQSRLGGNLLGPNTQLPSLSQESFLNKNQMLSSLASNHGLPGGMSGLGGMGGEDGGLGKRRRSFGDGSMSPLRKRPSHGGQGRLSGGSEMKLAADLVALEEAHALRGSKPEPKSRRKAKTFPVKLMQALIENPDEEAVAWLPDGKSFVIVQPDLFVDIVLKKTFKECKYASFVRKLHRWGFVRLTSGTGTDCFHHPLFQRNRTDLCNRIVCTPRDPSKASETEKRVAAATSMTNDKPPSLAGVEKFFRSKPLGSATAAVSTTSTTPTVVVPPPPLVLPKDGDDKPVDDIPSKEEEDKEEEDVGDDEDGQPTEETSV